MFILETESCSRRNHILDGFSGCSSTFETTIDHLSILFTGSIGIFHPEKSGNFEIVIRQLTLWVDWAHR